MSSLVHEIACVDVDKLPMTANGLLGLVLTWRRQAQRELELRRLKSHYAKQRLKQRQHIKKIYKL